MTAPHNRSAAADLSTSLAEDEAREAANTEEDASHAASEPQFIDLVPDELTLARAQIDAGMTGLAEGTLMRRISWLESEGSAAFDELDAARLLLAEALFRQGRALTARGPLELIRTSSPQRRSPIALLVEAEALAAAAEPDRAAGLMERVLAAIGVDGAWELRRGAQSRLPWPLPAELRPEPRRAERPPWSAAPPADRDSPRSDSTAAVGRESTKPDVSEDSAAAARARLEAARVAYAALALRRGDQELAFAVRLDPAVAPDGVSLLEPTLGSRAPADRLLLFGDLLRAAGREAQARDVYDRAAAGDR